MKTMLRKVWKIAKWTGIAVASVFVIMTAIAIYQLATETPEQKHERQARYAAMKAEEQRQEAEEAARKAADKKAREEADIKAKAEAAAKAEAERIAKEEAQAKAKVEAEAKAKAEAEAKAKAEAEAEAKAEAERKAKEEAQAKLRAGAVEFIGTVNTSTLRVGEELVMEFEVKNIGTNPINGVSMQSNGGWNKYTVVNVAPGGEYKNDGTWGKFTYPREIGPGETHRIVIIAYPNEPGNYEFSFFPRTIKELTTLKDVNGEQITRGVKIAVIR